MVLFGNFLPLVLDFRMHSGKSLTLLLVQLLPFRGLSKKDSYHLSYRTWYLPLLRRCIVS